MQLDEETRLATRLRTQTTLSHYLFYGMPSLLLLLVMSLTLACPQARDTFRSPKVAAKPLEATQAAANETAIESKTVALSDAATAPPALAIIEAATKDLSIQSEIDAPMLVKFWPSQQTELLPGAVVALVEQPAGVPIETTSVAEFFRNSASLEDWMSDDEKASAQRFQKLTETLNAQLENPRVFLFGERERTVVIIGKVKGGFGGVVTLVVET